jgi:sugar O-acyltransferase (sialic acid O-acetyltransferase NeuD family)
VRPKAKSCIFFYISNIYIFNVHSNIEQGIAHNFMATKKEKNIVMIGAGGHGKSVINVLWQAGYTVTAVIDESQEKWGHNLLGVPIISPESDIATTPGQEAIIAIGDNKNREKTSKIFSYLRWATVISPLATVYPHAKLGVGCVVLPGAIVGSDVFVGDHVIISSQAILAHDCKIGDFAHMAPGASLTGNVTVGEGSFLATGCNVIPGVTIGEWAMVGAGATVMRDVPDNGKAYGPSAKIFNK